uniref:Uncharacterized protein n=1 Tax=Rhizophora mucronata TaxID=61149 RepID=A0A2P2MU89_RHIMU
MIMSTMTIIITTTSMGLGVLNTRLLTL